jgi:hypothetical protein
MTVHTLGDLWNRVSRLERNDVDGAVAVYIEACEAFGECPEEIAPCLVMLQDEPTEIAARLKSLPPIRRRVSG